MNDLISIIIPVFNHAHTLKKCLASLQKQTYRPFEIIMVNDGSSDDFSSVIEALAYEYTFKVVNQKNKGAPSARNRGLADAQGEFVIFWDADTEADPEMLERMVNSLRDNPKVSYAYSRFKYGWKTIKSQEYDSEALRHLNYIDTTSLIRRKDLPASGWDETLKRFQDWDLWLTMLEEGKKGIFIPEVLYKKIVSGRLNISEWIPSFFYKLPWKPEKIRRYEEYKNIVLDKHRI